MTATGRLMAPVTARRGRSIGSVLRATGPIGMISAAVIIAAANPIRRCRGLPAR